MKKIFLSVLALTLALSAACTPQKSASSEKESAFPTAEATTEAAEEETTAPPLAAAKAALDALAADYEFEGVACITQNGAVAYLYTGGKDRNGADFTLQTPLPVGSVSKQFCAAAVMKLCEEGKLQTSDTLDRFFPDYKEGKRLTVHNLLSMRSGIPDIINKPLLAGASETNTYAQNREAVLQSIFAQTLEFEPDKTYQYSNSNFMLLSAVVEQLSGKTYADYLHEQFFTPLGMENTGSLDELQGSAPAWASGLAYPYAAGVATGAGDVISSAADMDKWMTALSNGTAVSAESYRLMTTDYATDTEDHYGYGLNVYGDGSVGHAGAIIIEDTPYCSYDIIGSGNSYHLFLGGSDCTQPDIEGIRSDIVDILKQYLK